jgi:hypothetical protein
MQAKPAVAFDHFYQPPGFFCEAKYMGWRIDHKVDRYNPERMIREDNKPSLIY